MSFWRISLIALVFIFTLQSAQAQIMCWGQDGCDRQDTFAQCISPGSPSVPCNCPSGWTPSCVSLGSYDCSSYGSPQMTVSCSSGNTCQCDPPPGCNPSCGACSLSCGGGTRTCTASDCSTYQESCNTQACPTPNCNTTIVCNPTCNTPPYTCYNNNGTQSGCMYTQTTQGGNCNQVPAPNQPCTYDACGAGNHCESGTCVPNTQQCTAGNWVNGACGGGTCAITQRQQTRTVDPIGCTNSTQCIADAACAGVPSGTIVVYSNMNTGWTLTGPTTISGSCSGSTCTAGVVYTGKPTSPPNYTITPDPISGYSVAVTPSSSQQLLSGGTTSFNITYTLIPTICNSGVDIGLRIYQNGIFKVAVEPGAPTSPLRIYSNGVKGVVLVPTTDANASSMRVQTSAGVKALCLLGQVLSASVTAPSSGATVSGSTTISASASSNAVGVQFKLDGNNLGAEDTTTPYSISWDTTTVANGSHTLTAVARDASAQTVTSSGVNVTIANTIIPTLTWYQSNCTTQLGTQNMQTPAPVIFASSGTYCLKVNTTMTLTFKGVAGGGGGAASTGTNGAGGGGGGAATIGSSVMLLANKNYTLTVGFNGTGGGPGGVSNGSNGGFTRLVNATDSLTLISLNGGNGSTGGSGATGGTCGVTTPAMTNCVAGGAGGVTEVRTNGAGGGGGGGDSNGEGAGGNSGKAGGGGNNSSTGGSPSTCTITGGAGGSPNNGGSGNGGSGPRGGGGSSAEVADDGGGGGGGGGVPFAERGACGGNGRGGGGGGGAGDSSGAWGWGGHGSTGVAIFIFVSVP